MFSLARTATRACTRRSLYRFASSITDTPEKGEIEGEVDPIREVRLMPLPERILTAIFSLHSPYVHSIQPRIVRSTSYCISIASILPRKTIHHNPSRLISHHVASIPPSFSPLSHFSLPIAVQ